MSETMPSTGFLPPSPRARRRATPIAPIPPSCCPKGVEKCAKKFGEEAVETALAAVSGDKAHLAAESADVLYHLLVLWAAAGITPDDVYAALEAREAQSGLAEKASRKIGQDVDLFLIGQALDQIQHALAHFGILDLHEGEAELQPFAGGDEFHHRRRAFRLEPSAGAAATPS